MFEKYKKRVARVMLNAANGLNALAEQQLIRLARHLPPSGRPYIQVAKIDPSGQLQSLQLMPANVTEGDMAGPATSLRPPFVVSGEAPLIIRTSPNRLALVTVTIQRVEKIPHVAQ